MALAFHLLTHRNVRQIALLLESIWNPGNLYVLHHDRRRPRAEHAELATLAKGFKNVFIQPPTAVLWGRFSLFKAQLEGLKIALSQGGHPWTHWINLSGQCFPLRPVSELDAFLAKHPTTSFIRYFDPFESNDWKNPEDRLRRKAFDSPALEKLFRAPVLGRRLRSLVAHGHCIPSRARKGPRPPFEVRWYGGDNWVVLSRKAARHLAASEDITRQLSDTLFPEESIFQTALVNASESERDLISNRHLRSIKWGSGAGSPEIFRAEDFPRLKEASEQESFFARKFDLEADPAIFALIQKNLLS